MKREGKIIGEGGGESVGRGEIGGKQWGGGTQGIGGYYWHYGMTGAGRYSMKIKLKVFRRGFMRGFGESIYCSW